MTALQIENISKRFGPKLAVDGVSLEAEGGEFIVLLGPSGCGKTTLLRMIAGLETADSGAMRLNGRDITRLEPRARDIAMVFQSYALYPHMTVAENIAYPLKVRKKPKAEIEREVTDVARRLGLESLLMNRPRQLSGGERQRVALARAIVRHPQAFLMDEPLSNLDARLRVDMRAELKYLQHQLRTVTLYVTHDQSEAMTLAHRIAVMDRGQVQQFDTPENIYNRPANLFVAGFLGSPSMNLLADPDQPGVTLGIRPEDVEFSTAEQPGWQKSRVYVTEAMGNETIVKLSTEAKHITTRIQPGARPDFDAPAWYRFRPEKIHHFDSSSGARLP
jgi:multiple sugar transport system ATP-binding protein